MNERNTQREKVRKKQRKTKTGRNTDTKNERT